MSPIFFLEIDPAFTGPATVTKNGWFDDHLNFTQPKNYSVSDMFFKPYASNEFIYCARHVLLGGIIFLCPAALMTLIGLGCAITLGLVLFPHDEHSSNEPSWERMFAMAMRVAILRHIVDAACVMVAAMALITRGISTGLQAAGLYDYDASPSLA